MAILQFWDYVCIGLYLLAVLLIGVVCSEKKQTTRNYLLAEKKMSWWPVALSIYATVFSSISFVASPGETFRYDLQYAAGLIIAPFVTLLAIVLFLDFFYRRNIVTVFEYLETRFNARLRTLTATVFVFYRATYAAVVIYALSLAVHVTTDLPMVWISIVLGIVTTLYTFLGGAKAVIWTDVMQVVVFVVGIVLIAGFLIAGVPGGLAEIARVANEHQKLKLFNFNLSLTDRMTFWGVALVWTFSVLKGCGLDQMTVQRALAAKNIRQSKVGMIASTLISIPPQILLYLIGVGLFVYYIKHPSPQVASFVAAGKHDKILPYFIVHSLPVGIRGLLIAALMAAAMSTMSSVLSALSAITIRDIYGRWLRPDKPDWHYLRASKVATALWGLAVTLLAYSMQNIGSIVETSGKILGVFVGPIMGIFLLGLFVRRVDARGALAGAVTGLVGAFFVLYGLKWLGGPGLSFTWAVPVGTGLTMGVGYVVNCLSAAADPKKLDGNVWRYRNLRSMLLD